MTRWWMITRSHLYMVKKKHFTTSSQVKKTLQEVALSISTIMRQVCRGKYRVRGRHKPLTDLKSKESRLYFAPKNISKSWNISGTIFIRQMKLKSICSAENAWNYL